MPGSADILGLLFSSWARLFFLGEVHFTDLLYIAGSFINECLLNAYRMPGILFTEHLMREEVACNSLFPR